MRALLTTLFLLAAFAIQAIGRPALRPIAHPPISGYVDGTNLTQLDEVLSACYKFIIIGGGNSGLALASRLSSHAQNTVLVLEAGTHQPKNENMTVPGYARRTIGSEIDWAFKTAPQRYANNRTINLPRGKVVGGTTAINFMAVMRGFAPEYEAWAELAGSKAWTFNRLLPFFKQSESFTAPGTNNQHINRTFTPSAHGDSGPVEVSYTPFIPPQVTGFFDAMRGLGVPAARDFCDGRNVGVNWFAQSVDPRKEARVTSDTAYVAPIAATRSNLVILTSAQATKILWSNSIDSENKSLKVASGVEFVVGSSTHTVQSTGEVILSAGSIQSPQLLELSGVGDPAILTPLGIDTVIDLPGVGANLQDHQVVTNVYELKAGFNSYDTLTGPALAEAVKEYATGQGILTSQLSTSAFLSAPLFLSPRDRLTALALLSVPSPALPANQQAALHSLYTSHAPVVEVVPLNAGFGQLPLEPNTSYISLGIALSHPLSRGTVHITSADPLEAPGMDPAYLQHPFDGFVLAKASQFLRRLANQEPFKRFVERETEPGEEVQSDEEFVDWVRGNVRTQHHPIKTASMLPRDKNGVVDPNLLVYGTSNVRVVDLSVVPLHLSTHPQSVAYAIAEKAATIINGARDGSKVAS